jgi:hypothetical protein
MSFKYVFCGFRGISVVIQRRMPMSSAVVLFAAAAALNLTGVSICSSAGALAKNLAASISTNTPAKGENVTTVFDFDLDTPITGGTAQYAASLNGFPYSASAPLCDETQKSGDPCPLAAGHHHQVSTSTNSVSGKLVTKITWVDESDAEILCVEIATKTA